MNIPIEIAALILDYLPVKYGISKAQARVIHNEILNNSRWYCYLESFEKIYITGTRETFNPPKGSEYLLIWRTCNSQSPGFAPSMRLLKLTRRLNDRETLRILSVDPYDMTYRDSQIIIDCSAVGILYLDFAKRVPEYHVNKIDCLVDRLLQHEVKNKRY